MSINIEELNKRKIECYENMKQIGKNDEKYLELYREYHRLKNKISYHTDEKIQDKKKEYAIKYLQKQYKTPEYNAYKRLVYKQKKSKSDIPVC